MDIADQHIPEVHAILYLEHLAALRLAVSLVS